MIGVFLYKTCHIIHTFAVKLYVNKHNRNWLFVEFILFSKQMKNIIYKIIKSNNVHMYTFTGNFGNIISIN